MSNLICGHCLAVQKRNPGLTAKELSPVGSFDAVTLIDGNALCQAHAFMVIYTPETLPNGDGSKQQEGPDVQ